MFRLVGCPFSKKLPYHQLFQPISQGYLRGSFRSFTTLLPKKDINIRMMTKEDLRKVIEWAKEEGWNPGKYEVEPFYALDPTGYQLLEIDGQAVASLANVKYSKNFAFLGLFIVKPEYRGMGYGKLLWDVSMEKLKAHSSIGLNAVMEQVDNYSKSGFFPHSINTRWQRNTINTDMTVENKVSYIHNPSNLFPLLNYDRKIFRAPRNAFIEEWLKMPESHALAAVENGELQGYGVLSCSEEGYKIAPLYANNTHIAEGLFQALARILPDNTPIYIDTNEKNTGAALLADRLGFKPVFETIRMYKGELPSTDDSKIFSLSTLEIG